jgi:tRNA dimethylallyltransferase
VERKVIVIAGPTCSGKTRLAINIAEKMKSEIISADSRQVFKYLNIGTATPSVEELAAVKHHFINMIEPDEEFNASIFEKSALKIIDELIDSGKVPVVAGGSGLYIKALLDGITESADCDEAIRSSLMKKLSGNGQEYLYDELKKVDPEAASGMLPQNFKRVIRALEVYYTTGKSILQHHVEHERQTDLKFDIYGVNWPREILYKNIETRVDNMLDEGLIGEVENILSMGYSAQINALNTVGYKEIISYLSGEISIERAVELIKRNTRHYAKRQMTWFRAEKKVQWLEVNSISGIEKLAENILSKYI